ncbi:MAG: DUF4262 domain-containing protein [Oryzihumus sp.]
MCEGESIQEIVDSLKAKIAEYGYTKVLVDGSGHVPYHFGYSLGLADQLHPEVFLRGPMPPNVVAGLVDHLVHKVQEGLVLSDGLILDGLLKDGYTLRVHGPVAADDAETHLAVLLFGDLGQTAYQVLWPDQSGRFPTDPDFDPKLASSQPLAPKIGA